MAINKKNEFPSQDVKLAEIAKAVSHPARIAILRLLSQKGGCNCGAIVNELPLSQSTVSQHLKELKQAGLITGDAEGPKMTYKLAQDQLRLSNIWFNHFFEQTSKH